MYFMKFILFFLLAKKGSSLVRHIRATLTTEIEKGRTKVNSGVKKALVANLVDRVRNAKQVVIRILAGAANASQFRKL